MTRTDRHRLAAAVMLTVPVVAILVHNGNTHGPIPPAAAATVATTPATSQRGYPARVTIPDSLAYAIGHARAATSTRCTGAATTQAWAEIDEVGNVVDIVTGCGTP